MTHTYTFICTGYDATGRIIYQNKIKAHNKYTELQAKMFIEDNVKRKYPNVVRITLEETDTPFDDIFGNIFK